MKQHSEELAQTETRNIGKAISELAAARRSA